MNKASKSDEMREKYDFSDAVKGKHHRAYQEGSNVVLLEPDVAEKFKDPQSVNHARRMLISLAGRELERNITK